MLLVARALLVEPQLMLLDEISEGVQPSVLHRIAAALAGVNRERGTTTLDPTAREQAGHQLAV